MIGAFERMTKSVLAVLGEGALFNGATPCRINVEYDVQFAGIDGDGAQYRGDIGLSRDVATIEVSLSPKIGDRFQFVDKTTALPTGPVFYLDKFVDQNGYTKRFVVRKGA